MRCTRCDGFAVPQALGRLPDGRLAFGWCLSCLETTGCAIVAVGRVGGRRRRPSSLLDLPPAEAATPAARAIHEDIPIARRGRDLHRATLTVVAAVMGIWGLMLGLLGVVTPEGWLATEAAGDLRPVVRVAALGMGLTGLILAAMAWLPSLYGRGRGAWLKGVEVAASLAALAILLLGLANHDPGRDPWIIAAAAAALALAAVARRTYRRLPPARRRSAYFRSPSTS
jgi:hypothetical protein